MPRDESAAAYANDTGALPEITPIVDTTNGPVRGLVNYGVHTFKGIRYGAPPVGPLRWMPPRKPEPSNSVLDCSDYGAPAMQMVSPALASPRGDYGMQVARVFTTSSELKIQNEDCLFLNVWTPAADNRKRPVMFWIHGGIFAYGSGNHPIYCMEDLARDYDVVAVNVNHRLNVFGYLHLGELMGDEYQSSGTVGIQDLVLALEWVRDNIANFGGDPGNVTIMGQSGGGAKVSILMSMDPAKGLFHKASIQSGPGLMVGRRDTAAAAAKALLDKLGVRRGDIGSLQALPAQTIIAAAYEAEAEGGAVPRVPGMTRPPGFAYGPIIDGRVITRDPFTPDAPEVSRDVPILIGCVKDETTLYAAREPWFRHLTESELEPRIAMLGPKGRALVEAWRKIRPDYSPSYLLTAAMSSMFAFGGTATLAERKAAQRGAPAYAWYMTWESPVAGGMFRTPHTMEIAFTLNSYRRARAWVGPDPGAARMAKQFAGAWVAFARTGNPDCAEIPHWPAYDASARATMVFDLESRVVNDPNSEVRKILQA
jgi:para-nitrobenzyl esterase